MRTNLNPSESINYSDFYQEYRNIVLAFITRRVPHKYEAEDLTQDVFIRLWEHWAFVNQNTICSLLYTIARNIITDRIRRYYKQEDCISYIYNNVGENNRNPVEENMDYRDLKQMHNEVVLALPSRRCAIYQLSFNENLPTMAIAEKMSLSPRTVEGHLLLARKKVRTYIQNEISKVG